MHLLIKQTITFLLLLSMTPAFGQNDHIWIFGDKAGIDFNSGTPQAMVSNMIAQEGCASVCDDEGNLLFYTNGDLVWNADHTLMPNGINISGAGMAISLSTSQGALIIPMPGNNQQYYVFTLGAVDNGYYAGRLYYSIVDMGLDNGRGDVIRKGTFLDAFLTEQMTAIGGPNCNIWLLAVDRARGAIKAWNIDDNGIDTIPVISPGVPITGNVGCMDVAPDGTKLVLASANTALFDFNTTTGLAANPVILFPYANTNYGVCFSPDNSKLYVGGKEILQYDLSLMDSNRIIQSRTVISNSRVDYIKRGPNGKLYCTTAEGLDIIHQPNLQGLSCQLTKNAFTLMSGSRSTTGLPNTIVKRPQRDTIYTSKTIEAGCFTNHLIVAPDKSGEQYQWNDGSTNPQRRLDKGGIYWLQYKMPCTVYIDTFKVSFPNGLLPNIQIRNSCKSQQTGKVWAYTFAEDSLRYQYLWQNNNGDILSFTDTLEQVPTGNYTLRITTTTCDTTLSFFLPEEMHQVSFEADSIICQGAEPNFVNTSDPDFTHFQWNLGDENQSNSRAPIHTYHRSGSYEVTLIGIGKICRDTASKIIMVDSMHAVHFTTEPSRICVGENISFYPVTDQSAVRFSWQFGDGAAMHSEKEQVLQHAYAISGIMPATLEVQFRACPKAYFSDTVNVFALPDVSLGSTFGLCPNSAPVILKNVTHGTTSFHKHSWNTGDTSPHLKITHPGLYTLTVQDTLIGCSSTASVDVTKDCYTDIPNAFSPNGDGMNDYFFPRTHLSNGAIALHLQIRNRWGHLLFETRGLNGRGWDGNYNGQELPVGVYLYHINITYAHGHTELLQGNITLIR